MPASTPKEAIKTLFMKEMLAQGILIAGSNNVTYAHSEADVARIAAAYDNTFARIADELKAGTLVEESRLSAGACRFSRCGR